MQRFILSAVMLFFLLPGACNTIRPQTRYGPVIDASRVVSVSLFFRGGSGMSPPPPDTLMIRHFYYYARPASWSLISAGENRPVTLFEEAGVYALTTLGLSRLTRLPHYRSDGVTPPRLHIAAREQYPASPFLIPKERFIVYIEGGAIYGGLTLGASPDPQNTSERDLKLLVDGQVYRADLASDGESIVFLDTAYRLFVLPAGQQQPVFLLDVKDAFGASTVKGVRWSTTYDEVFLLVDRGQGFDQVWSVNVATAALTQTGGPPDRATNIPTPAFLESVEETTRRFGYDDWKVRDPASFAE